MKDLNEIRKLIDDADDELKAAFIKRLNLLRDVAAAKKISSAPVYDGAREKAVVSRLTEGLPENFAGYVEELYSVIFSVSKAFQSELLADAPAAADKTKN